jgi:hypothetical protein
MSCEYDNAACVAFHRRWLQDTSKDGVRQSVLSPEVLQRLGAQLQVTQPTPSQFSHPSTRSKRIRAKLESIDAPLPKSKRARYTKDACNELDEELDYSCPLPAPLIMGNADDAFLVDLVSEDDDEEIPALSSADESTTSDASTASLSRASSVAEEEENSPRPNVSTPFPWSPIAYETWDTSCLSSTSTARVKHEFPLLAHCVLLEP